MNLLLATVLVLHPVLDEPADVRMVAVGTGEEEVEWWIGGEQVATSRDREGVRVALDAGRHEVEARTAHDGAWEILVRPEPTGHEGASYVPAWTARHEPLPMQRAGVPDWLWAVPLLLVASGAAAGPRLRRMAGRAKQP